MDVNQIFEICLGGGAGSVSVYCVSVRTEFDPNYPACTCNPSAAGGGAHMMQENPWGLMTWGIKSGW